MPDLSGFDVVKQIRSRPEFAKVALTGYADSRFQQQSLDADCDQHLAKPAQLLALESAIDAVVAKRQAMH